VRLPGQTTAASGGWQASRADACCASILRNRASLQSIQPLVKPAPREQLLMGSTLSKLPADSGGKPWKPSDPRPKIAAVGPTAMDAGSPCLMAYVSLRNSAPNATLSGLVS
jgi:hypothetical protein